MRHGTKNRLSELTKIQIWVKSVQNAKTEIQDNRYLLLPKGEMDNQYSESRIINNIKPYNMFGDLVGKMYAQKGGHFPSKIILLSKV